MIEFEHFHVTSQDVVGIRRDLGNDRSAWNF